MITEVGPVDIDVPRDRDSSFEPATVKKRHRRLNGVDAMVISLTAKGLTTGEVQAHLAETYGTEVSRETISKITDRVLDDLAKWQNRPAWGCAQQRCATVAHRPAESRSGPPARFVRGERSAHGGSQMYRCNKCDEFVEDEDRTAHSASRVHQSNGGNAEVDEEDYEEGVPGTRGMSKT